MNKKILILIIVAVVIAIIVAFSFLKPGSEEQETKDLVPEEKKEVTMSELEESIKSTIQELGLTCADFLKGDLSGNPSSDCPGFSKQINRDLCYYCYGIKNQDIELCGRIDDESALSPLCKIANGAPVEEMIK